MSSLQIFAESLDPNKKPKHPKCKGYYNYSVNGDDGGCGYESEVICEDCRYMPENNGRGKDPAAKRNQIKD